MSEPALEDAPIAGDVVDANEPVEPAEPVVEAAPAPYDPTDDPRILDLVQTQAAAIADRQFREALAQAQAQQPTVTQTESFFDEEGNFLPHAFAEFQTKRDEQLAKQFKDALAQVTQPLEAQRHAEAVAEGEQQMRDVIADLSVREKVELRGGERAITRIIEDVRNVYFPQVSQTYGMTNRAAEIALEKAFRAEAEYQKSIADPAVEAHVNRNATLAGVKGEPGLGGGNAVQTQPAEVYKPGELSRKYGNLAQQIRT